jgi:putative hemolysin
MFLEGAIVVVLIVLNGLLAMSELAIVSARPGRLRAQAERGSYGARTALRLAGDPGRFLSTVQIGITLVGVLAGAFSGATIGTRLARKLPDLGVPQTIAQEVGVGIVVIVITYFTLIVGELVPKQIALASPERVAMRVAPAMLVLSRIAAPLVWLLDRSGKLLLRLMGRSGQRASPVTDEDIRMVLSEAAGAGVIHRAEKELIGGVMRFSDRKARGLMTPRHDVEIAGAEETREQIVARFASSGHSRLPLRHGGQDDIVGILHSRDLLDTANGSFDPLDLARTSQVVQDTLPALDVVDRLRSSACHMLLVYDEYGHFEGIITPMDVLATIAGGFDEHEADEPKLITREDGSMLVAGWMPIDEFAERIGLSLPREGGFNTVAGFVLHLIADMPRPGQTVMFDGWRIEIVDMDNNRIDKLLIARSTETGQKSPPGQSP